MRQQAGLPPKTALAKATVSNTARITRGSRSVNCVRILSRENSQLPDQSSSKFNNAVGHLIVTTNESHARFGETVFVGHLEIIE